MRVKELLLTELFIEEREGKIYFINEKYDGLSLDDINDYHFLYDVLAHFERLPEKIYSEIKKVADFLKQIEDIERDEANANR